MFVLLINLFEVGKVKYLPIDYKVLPVQNKSEKKIAVKTPWGNLVKAKSLQELIDKLTNEIIELNKKIREFENNSPKLPDLPGTKGIENNTDKYSQLESRIITLESDLKEIKEKQNQIREKFAVLSQQILKLASK